MNVRRAWLAMATAGTLLVAACGGGSSDSSDSGSGGSGGTGGGSGSSGSGGSGPCQAQTTPAGTYLVAPQLFVAGPGSITVTLQAAIPSLSDIFLFGASGTTVSSPSFGVPALGVQAQQPTVTPFQPGADIALGAGFRGTTPGSEPLSLTARPAQFPIGILNNIANPGDTGASVAENAGVMQTTDGVLIGFNAPGTPTPATFSGFGVRISVSNVCVR